MAKLNFIAICTKSILLSFGIAGVIGFLSLAIQTNFLYTFNDKSLILTILFFISIFAACGACGYRFLFAKKGGKV